MANHPHDDYSTDGRVAPSLSNHLKIVHGIPHMRVNAMTIGEAVGLHKEEHLPDPGISSLDIHIGTLNDMDGILALVTGYRAKCEAAGFGEDCAEMMAVHLLQAVCFRIGMTTLEAPVDA